MSVANSMGTADTPTFDTLALARQLIREESVTPRDGACQQIIADLLTGLGFTVERLPFGEVSNLWAIRQGSEAGPLFAFAGHTDVVPPGPLDEWQHPPFAAHVAGDLLHGRGAADMKGSLAAMLAATDSFLRARPSYQGSIAFLITSDEEGPAVDGTVRVMETLASRNIAIDYCLVGEPSSGAKLGDAVRVGRRGSLGGELRVRGVQGHVAYPEDVVNPIHLAAPALAALAATRWDEGNAHFPPTSFQISNIAAGTGATNVVPGELTVQFNFRFSTESSAEDLQARTQAILDQHALDYQLDWRLSGQPFITEGGELIPAVEAAIQALLGYAPQLSTAGGTSDGRFIAPTGTQVVELGPCNATIHKVNEQASISELQQLAALYADIMKRLLPAA